MAKNINKKSAAVVVTVDGDEAQPKVISRKVAPAVPVAIEGSVTDPTRKLTREEWRALSPDEKRARKEAKRTNRPELAARFAKNMTRFARRISKLSAMIDKNAHTDLARALTTAREALHEAAVGYEALPTGWQPLKSEGVQREAKFGVGDMVDIHAKRRSNYDGLLDADEMTGLRITKVAGKRLVVQTESGTRLFLPSNAVVRSAA